jgi:methylase of polypeptide subunit release factors
MTICLLSFVLFGWLLDGMVGGGHRRLFNAASVISTFGFVLVAGLFASQIEKPPTGNDDLLLAHIYQAIQAAPRTTLDEQPSLCYIEASTKDGWYAQNILKQSDLTALHERSARNLSLVIPIFPTVYSPGDNSHFGPDAAYYNYILKSSRIKKLDKVLVVGSGSGADSWVAWQKSQAMIFAIDINPVAVANTRATARIGTFPIRAIQGDIGTMELPQDFSGFDKVLWNMPFLDEGNYSDNLFHDHDHGDVLDKFLARLPALMNTGGEAILLNTQQAVDRMQWAKREVIQVPGKSSSNSALYIIVLKE